MKKWIAGMLCVVMMFSVNGCEISRDSLDRFRNSNPESSTAQETLVNNQEIKVGILLNGDQEAPGNIAHIEALRKMQTVTGLKDSQIMIEEKVTKKDCQNNIKNLLDGGCTLIISTDMKYQDKILEAAKGNPQVQFCQEGGNQAKQSKLENMHDYYSRIYEGYYVAGVIAGLKLNAMIEKGTASNEDCAIGFVASDNSARSISSYTAFLLGVRRENSNAHLIVRYVDASGNYKKDAKEASQLVLAGVKIMSTNTSTNAVATVCAEHDIPVVGCDSSVLNVAPDEAITSVVTDWSSYYIYAVTQLANAEAIDADWCQGYKENVVGISKLNDSKLVDGMTDEVINQENKMRNDITKVFELTGFTIGGDYLDQKLSSKKYKAYAGYVSEGQFHESEHNSAPAFDIIIDGVEISTEDLIAAREAALKELEESTRTEEETEETQESQESENDDNNDDNVE